MIRHGQIGPMSAMRSLCTIVTRGSKHERTNRLNEFRDRGVLVSPVSKTLAKRDMTSRQK